MLSAPAPSIPPAGLRWLASMGYEANWAARVVADPALAELPHIATLLSRAAAIKEAPTAPYLEALPLTPEKPPPTPDLTAAERAWHLTYTLRELLAAHGIDYPRECHAAWQWYQHSETGQTQLRPIACHDRDICPRCGDEYGRTRGREMQSLVSAALARRRTPAPHGEPAIWHIVLTLPPAAQAEMICASAESSQTRLRRVISSLSGGVRAYLAAAFGAPPGQIGAILAWHYWHSARPVGEPYWHLHVLVPNCSRAGFSLARRGVIAPERLDAALGVWRRALVATFSDAEIPDQLNHHLRYVPHGPGLDARVAHLSRYVARHPMSDLLTYARSEPGVYSEGAAAASTVRAWGRVQSIKTIRYLGYLAPGQRKAVGLVVDELEPSLWTKVPGGHRRLVTWQPGGLWVSWYAPTGRCEEFVPTEQLRVRSTSPPRFWKYALEN